MACTVVLPPCAQFQAERGTRARKETTRREPQAGSGVLRAGIPEGHSARLLPGREPPAVGAHERQARRRLLRSTPDFLLAFQLAGALPRVLHHGGGSGERGAAAARVPVVLRGFREVGVVYRGGVGRGR
ncbi:unnamed protein product, partial [Pylaiella littoralis]